MTRRTIENLQYLVLMAIILAQCVVGEAFYIGQGIYLVANTISVFRSFALRRPTSDKVKDVACLAITIGLILFKIFA